MWYEFLLEGLKKFSGEIIGLILLAVFWRMFPGLRNWFKTLKKDDADDADVRQALEKIQRQLEAQRQDLEQEKAIKHAAAMSDKYFLKLCAFGDALEIEKTIINGANVNAKDNDGFNVCSILRQNGNSRITH